MKLERKRIGRIELLTLPGGLTGETLNHFRPDLTRLTHEEGIEGVILNFDKVDVMDARGIGFIALLFKNFRQRGVKFLMTGVNPFCKELMHLCHLDRIITILENEESALEFIR